MNDIKLKQFIRDEGMRESVKEKMLSMLDKQALKDVYSEVDTKHYKSSKDAIKRVFAELERLYRPVEQKDEEETLPRYM